MGAIIDSRIGLDAESWIERAIVRDVQDIRRAAISIRDFAGCHGLRSALCANIASKEVMTDADGVVLASDVFGWAADGERWWEDPRLALHSLLPRACRYESEPFWCNANGFFTTTFNPYLQEIDTARFFESQFALRAAIVVPVHLPFAQVSANSFVPADPLVDDLGEVFERIGDTLAAMTRRFITGYIAARRPKRRIPSGCELSKREVECLHWAAIGKTDSEIATIIELSHATIRYHINRASEKLNAVNRAQTVFKAGQLGYLGASA
ncbi:LuxR C-terminal-related transcriptional regulator [Sphingobium sp. Sx8-8]|uniref:helix-turn-helix transcriptional regulator n=1 Tax=Sphingobium sp. Sx8-8 TaxID=2933617 RepID=UPI001F579ADE|nr:LuxR C-terminal-related transcriptional regulator [Sphingobium sp. Sx8-8]